MVNLDLLFLFYYLGLLVFAFNGMQLLALRSKQKEMKVIEERIMRLLLRVRR